MKEKSIWHSDPVQKSSGVAILLKENINFQIINFIKDEKSQIPKCYTQTEQQIFQLINIYAPTKLSKKTEFCQKLSQFLDKDFNAILAGDFNMIANIFLDKLVGNTSNIHLISLEKLKEIKNKHDLENTWIKKNPHKRLFTYHNADKTIHSSLDRIYLSKTIKTISCKIIPISISDHNSVSVIVQISEKDPRGPSVWKLNTSILKQKENQEILKQ